MRIRGTEGRNKGKKEKEKAWKGGVCRDQREKGRRRGKEG